jgi:hypothetical protein
MGTNDLAIKIHESSGDAINYDKENKSEDGKWKQLNLKQFHIVKNGTIEGRPTVDLILEDENGQKYVAMITGRLIKQATNIISFD